MTTIYTAAKTNEGWVVKLAGKIIRWMTGSETNQQAEANWFANDWNSTRVKTAREMAETSHNLDRRGGIATTKDGAKWVWVSSADRWARA